MKRLLVTVCAVTVSATIPAVSGQDADPFVGTWKTNFEKSQYEPASRRPEKPSILTREVSGNGFRVTSRLPGREPHLDYSFDLSGKDYPVKGTPSVDSVAVIPIDRFTQVQLRKKDGVVVALYRQIVSKDRKTFSSYEVGYKAGSDSYHNVLVFDRQ